MRRPPGGVWFLIGVAFIGALVALPLMRTSNGKLVVWAGAVAWGAILTTTFGIQLVSIVIIERTYHKKVFIWPDGFHFENRRQ